MKRLLISSLVAVTSVVSIAPLASAETYSTTVSAQDCWMDTKLYVDQGDTLFFRSSGQWSNGEDNSHQVGPNGYSEYFYDFAESSSIPFAALIGKIDNNSPFLVGSHSLIR